MPCAEQWTGSSMPRDKRNRSDQEIIEALRELLGLSPLYEAPTDVMVRDNETARLRYSRRCANGQ